MSPERGRLRRYVDWVARRELWFLLLASPPLWVPGVLGPLVPASFAVVIVVAASRWIARGRPFPRTALNWPILGLLLALPAGIWASPDAAASWEVACRVVLGVTLFHGLVSGLRGGKGVARLFWVLAWGGVAISALGLVAADWQSDKLPFLEPLYRYLPRMSMPAFLAGRSGPGAGLFHPNMIGGALAVLIPIGVGLLGWSASAPSQIGGERHETASLLRNRFLLGARRLSPSILGLTLALMGITLLLTQARMALLAVALALGLWVAMSYRRLRVSLTVASLGLALLLTIYGVDGLGAYLLQIPEAGTWYARPELWRAALEATRDYPFTGVGLGMFDPVARANYIVRVYPTWYFGHSHNLILQAGVELGLVGQASFLALIGMGVYTGWSAWSTSSRRERWLAGAALGALLAYVIFGTLNCIPLGSKPGFLVWLVLAACVILAPDRDPASLPNASREIPRGRVLVAIAVAAAIVVVAARSALGYSLNLNLGAVSLDRVQLGTHEGEAEVEAERAAQHLERALSYRDTQTVHRRLGLVYALKGDLPRALVHFTEDEEALSFLMLRADLHLAAQELASARVACELAKRIDSESSGVWYRLGQVSELQGDLGEALANYGAALTFGTFTSTEEKADSHFRRAEIFSLDEEWERAAAEYASAADLVPSDASYRAGLAWALYSCCGQVERAETELRQAIGLDPTVSLSYRRLVAIYGAEEQPQNALALAHDAVAVAGSEPWGHILRAEVYLSLDRPGEAKDDYEAAIAIGPVGAAARIGLAKAYWALGQSAQAIEQYELAVAQAPGAVWYRLGLANAYFETGRVGEALTEYEEALRLSPSNSVAQEGVRKTQQHR